MQKETKSIGFACALGAFIGALVALELVGNLWFVGVIAGGIVGYIAYNPREVFRSFAQAWHVVTVLPSNRRKRVLQRTLFASMFMGVCKLVFWGVIFAALSFGILDLDVLVPAAVFLTTLLTAGLVLKALRGRKDYAKTIRGYRDLSHELGPVVVLATIAKALWETLRALLWLVSKLPAVGKQTFIYIHSSQRTLCFVDATLGATAGYILGSALIGAGVGLVLGVINYELVSIRILKLAPRRL